MQFDLEYASLRERMDHNIICAATCLCDGVLVCKRARLAQSTVRAHGAPRAWLRIHDSDLTAAPRPVPLVSPPSTRPPRRHPAVRECSSACTLADPHATPAHLCSSSGLWLGNGGKDGIGVERAGKRMGWVQRMPRIVKAKSSRKALAPLPRI
jgi:hypothetical protein